MPKEYHFGIYGPPEILTMEVENLITDKAKEYNGEWYNSGTAFGDGVIERDICYFFTSNGDRKKFKKVMVDLFEKFGDKIVFSTWVEDEQD